MAYTGLGSCLVNHFQDDEGAEAAFRQAIALQPNYWIANYGLGFALLRQGKPVEAVDHLRQALPKHPNDVLLTRLLCFALARLGRGQESQAVWRQMLETHPDDHQAWNGYPELCLFLGQNDEYRRVRTAFLERFAKSKDPAILHKTARASLLLPDGEDELRRASALVEAAQAPKNRDSESLRQGILFTRALADYRHGRLDSAISLLEGEGAGIPGPAPDLGVAMARYRQGRPAEALLTFTKGVLAFDWSAARLDDADAWTNHVLRREAEALILPTLQAFLQGAYQPKHDDEKQALAAARLASCEIQDLVGSAARSYSDLFRADPKLAESVTRGSRYFAACMAAQAGCARGKDANELDDKERTQRRRQALEWLRQDLAAWSHMLDSRDSKTRTMVQDRLSSWGTDFELSCVRVKEDLTRLPAEERQQWSELWSDVNAQLRRARKLE